MSYSYVTFGALKAALLQRLQDIYVGYTSSTGSGMVSPTEAGIYLVEALRILNANCALWNIDYLFNFAPGDGWKSLNISGSPRQRTITDTAIEIEMEYMLLEPPSGGTWTGTTQFNIADISNALQFRRDEILLTSAANMVNFQEVSPISGNRSSLPDTLLDLRRVRWVPVPLSNIPAYPLAREDRPSVNAYGDTDSLQQKNPESWLITANTPLQFDVNCIPNSPGNWDILALESGAALAPPAATVLGLPNDWCWLAKYAALADVLSNSPEGADQLRAKYCLDRYQRGLKTMLSLPWLINATIANLPIDTPSVEEADTYAQNWEVTWPAGDPQIVVGGVDLVAVAPFNPATANVPVSSVLTLVGNAPVPVADGDQIQLSRDGVDAILGYAQHIAMFKIGGAEFAATLPLYTQFEAYCAGQNALYAALSFTRPLMLREGNRADDFDPRFERSLIQESE